MFICNDCGEIFDEPRQSIILHDEVDCQREEYYDTCPSCGENDIDVVVQCTVCNDYIAEYKREDYVAFESGDVVCNECLHDYCVENFS